MSRRDDIAADPLLGPSITVRLVPLQPEAPSADLLGRLADSLHLYLDSPVTIEPEMPMQSGWRVEEGAQLSSTAIVDSLIQRYPAGTENEGTMWSLGVTSSDLVADGRAYVFGEATLGGSWAVVSTARLGAPGDPRFEKRLLKEALHELGHLAGFGHCDEEFCLMAPATDLEAVDRRSVTLCPHCRIAL